jgi:hypothetical protein
MLLVLTPLSPFVTLTIVSQIGALITPTPAKQNCLRQVLTRSPIGLIAEIQFPLLVSEVLPQSYTDFWEQIIWLPEPYLRLTEQISVIGTEDGFLRPVY